VDGNASRLSQEGARCALTITCSGDSDLHDYAPPCHAGPAPSAAGGLLLADDEAQGSLLEPAGRADASEPGAPLALDSAGALTDAPPPEAREPSISGDDALDDVRGAGQGANQPASATGALIADEVSWIGTTRPRTYLPPARPTRTRPTSLMTRRRLSPWQTSLCCLLIGRSLSSFVALVLPAARRPKPTA
jgi:hypothetical protein